MLKITEPSMLASLEDGNRFIGEMPEMINSSITFSGKNNVLFCEKRVKLSNTAINFNADNAIVYLCENNNEYKLSLSVHNDNVFYSGKNNYFNGCTCTHCCNSLPRKGGQRKCRIMCIFTSESWHW